MTTPIIPARLRAFRSEDDARAPNRRKTSDGWYADKPGDHNMDRRGVVHADDTGQSMPGSPYWFDGINPLNGRPYDHLDVFAGARAVVANYRALTPPQRQARWRWLYDGGYMVWWEASLGYEAIFGPTVSLEIRPNGGVGRIGHVEHLHRSIAHTVAAENDTLPFFGNVGVPDDGGTMAWLTPVSHPSKMGYWCIDTEGHVRAYGAAKFHGGEGQSMKDGKPVPAGTSGSKVVRLGGPCAGLAPTPTGNGYWLLSRDSGAIFSFGDAPYLGAPNVP